VSVQDLTRRFGMTVDDTEDAQVLPLLDPTGSTVLGVLVAGISRLRGLDATYQSFLAQVAGHVATGIAAAQAHQRQRDRTEALVDLDRARTEFFNNVSHELRTPLTLLLGPLEEALGEHGLEARQRERLETAQRNAGRLLKLVNTLLDIARIEEGQLPLSYQATDLAALTAELVSGFSAAIAQVGLSLDLDCPPLAGPVYVDREMWEKVVLNLLSNALKFTFDGTIGVSLHARDGQAVLVVSDSGTGIPATELPHLFERFHRVRGATSRTHEGSGIGLALVHDLVRLHGGTVSVTSVVDLGTRFTVTLPLGRDHLRTDQVEPGRPHDARSLRRETYLEAASDEHHGDTPPVPAPADPTVRVLVVDDNADMRDYLVRLLAPHWSVEAVADGAAALASARAHPPDLVLTDVMMTGLTGLDLLKALREQPATRQVPVVLVSARAGPEASLEGLDTGADDYLVKPFAPRELLARVRVHVELARSRAQAAASVQREFRSRTAREESARFARMADETTDFVGLADTKGRVLYLNLGGRRMLGIGDLEDLSTTTVPDYAWPSGENGFYATERMKVALRDGVWRGETVLRHRDGHGMTTSQVLLVHRDERGEVAFFGTIARDMTLEREAEARLRAAEDRFRHAFEDAPVGIAVLTVGEDGLRLLEAANPALSRLLGHTSEALAGTAFDALVHPDDRHRSSACLDSLVRGEVATCTWEAYLLQSDGSALAASLAASLQLPAEERPSILLHVQDITERRRFETRLQRLADHDPLTGLLNRRRLMEQLEREVLAVHRYGGSGALLLLDLDNFKYVNDSLGHAAGDELIMRTADLLRQRLRESDTLSRLGGDEFAGLLPHADRQQAQEVAANLLANLQDGAVITSNAGTRRLSASIGIALFQQDEAAQPTGEELLVQADTAMYDAKEAGRAQAAVYDPHNVRQSRMEARLDVAERLREALDADRLVLYAQPIVGLQGDPGSHFELLLRMREDDSTLVLPASFLEVAERFHLIGAVDRWVIGEALGLLKAARLDGREVTLSINLSAQSILDPKLPDWIADAITAAGVDGRGLTFEVTETDAAVNFERANQLTRRLSELGCRFALDDFGTGYCSLHYLKHLSFDYLKIDGEFVKHLDVSAADQLILRAAVDIAHGLGKKTIAEGVESQAALDLLRAYGVDYAQGFHLAVPLPAQTALQAVPHRAVAT
jgi:diguanylate cyclase (GGDEF)-like protein/PAS domain S-box-containing protein